MNIYCNQAAAVIFLGWISLLLLKVVMASLSDEKAIRQDEDDDGDTVHSAKKLKLNHNEERPKQEKHKFPTTLKEFYYHFNKNGQLKHMETGEPFEFVARENDHSYNQQRYEALGEVITKHVYNLLETEAGLKRIPIPIDADDTEAKSFIFTSKEQFTETDKVLLLIHGNGVVRAGQWSRRLIVNDCLDSGTQLPYIKRAKQMGFEVMVLNSNLNKAANQDGKETSVRGSSNSKSHVLYVWDHFLENSPVKTVVIVAHSFGGVSSLNLAKNRRGFFKKVMFLALTDSVHSMLFHDASRNIQRWYSENAINWVTSDEPLDTLVQKSTKDCLRLSAGTKKHEETSWKSIDSVFSNLGERLEKTTTEEATSDKDEL
ncbi:cotranscriptional regulator ARB2A homolog [Apostichopus japonicus]|uniref:cotranscriptional regulator ARB2A homolog n=1 Tax=Stichopus japonicus TaxID=307972 RepID=UPI003AB3DA29